jgi:hypothetical protein
MNYDTHTHTCILTTPILATGLDVNGLLKYAALSADTVGEEAIDVVLGEDTASLLFVCAHSVQSSVS